MLESGLLVVILIVLTMLLILTYCLLFVKYEWCHVLFTNNTVSYNQLPLLLSFGQILS